MPITVEHFTRTYGSFTAVDDLSFEVQPGEIVGLIGNANTYLGWLPGNSVLL